MPAAGKLGQQANNAGVQQQAQDSSLQAWQALGAVTEVIPVVSPWRTATLCPFSSSSPPPQQPVWSAVGLAVNQVFGG